MVGVSVETIFGKEVYAEDAKVPIHISGTAAALMPVTTLEKLCQEKTCRIIINPSKIPNAFENAVFSQYSPVAVQRDLLFYPNGVSRFRHSLVNILYQEITPKNLKLGVSEETYENSGKYISNELSAEDVHVDTAIIQTYLRKDISGPRDAKVLEALSDSDKFIMKFWQGYKTRENGNENNIFLAHQEWNKWCSQIKQYTESRKRRAESLTKTEYFSPFQTATSAKVISVSRADEESKAFELPLGISILSEKDITLDLLALNFMLRELPFYHFSQNEDRRIRQKSVPDELLLREVEGSISSLKQRYIEYLQEHYDVSIPKEFMKRGQKNGKLKESFDKYIKEKHPIAHEAYQTLYLLQALSTTQDRLFLCITDMIPLLGKNPLVKYQDELLKSYKTRIHLESKKPSINLRKTVPDAKLTHLQGEIYEAERAIEKRQKSESKTLQEIDMYFRRFKDGEGILNVLRQRESSPYDSNGFLQNTARIAEIIERYGLRMNQFNIMRYAEKLRESD